MIMKGKLLMRKPSLKNSKYIGVSTVIIIFWQLISIGVDNQIIMSRIQSIILELKRILVNGDFISLTYYSLIRCFISFFISIIVAVILGVLSYFNKFIYNFTFPILMIIK